MPPANETPQQMRKRLTAAYTTAMYKEGSPFARRYGGINLFSSPKVSSSPPSHIFMNGGAKKTSTKKSSKKKSKPKSK